MLITVNCPLCETPVDADSTSFGTSLPCPKCEEAVDIPEAYIGEGVTLSGYELRGKIGKGGMGVVYLANQINMQRAVAVKVLPPSMTSNRESVERFLKEARMSARLEHPNIVTIIDAGEDTGFYFLAMRYVEGETLEERLKRHRPLPEKQALRYMGQVITALDFAWRHHKILHRDIKPSNIMIDEYDEVKLLDMGLAKDLLEESGSSLTVAGTILGTPYYMSPEQAKSSENLDFHSDMYSVGATLFHLLTGKTPFDGDGAVNIMTKHITTPAADVRTLNHGISEPTAHLVARLLEKKKEDRFESYHEVLDIINSILDDEDVIVPLTNPSIRMESTEDLKPTKVVSPQSRTLFLAAALAVCCLITGAIIIKVLQSGKTQADPVVVDPVSNPDPGKTAEQIAEEELRKEREAKELEEKKKELAKKQQLERDRVLKELSAIKKLASEDDAKLRQALKECRQLKSSYASTLIVAEIDQVLGDLEKRFNTYRDSVFKEINDKVESLRQERKFSKAVAYLDDYQGGLPGETRKHRERLLREVRRELDAQREEQRVIREREEMLKEVELLKKQKQFVKVLHETSKLVASSIIRQDYATARKQYEALSEGEDYRPFRADIVNTFLGIDDICNMDQTILDTFQEDIGKTITVKLKKKKDKELKIKGVEGTTVKAAWEVSTGTTRGVMASDFSVTDLTQSERYNRFKSAVANPESVNIMKSLLYLESDEKGKAISVLSKVNLPIARILLAGLGEPPERAINQLLDLAGLPRDEMDVGLLQRKFAQRDYTPNETKEIRLEASIFLERFRDNDDAAKYLPLVRMMAAEGLDYHFPKGFLSAKHNPVKADIYGAGAAESIRLQTRFSLANDLAVEAENSIGMRFLLIPEEAPHNHLGNAPTSAFYLGKYEVTAKQWKDVMGHCPFYRRDNLPVENITIIQAVEFLNKLCDREGIPRGSYRLPSSAEWVYACSAGVGSTYYFGDNAGRLSEFANYLDKSAPDTYDTWGLGARKDMEHSDGQGMTATIATYPANPWGLYDMLGNVAEYVADGELKFAMLRGTFKGGAWIFPAEFCHPAYVESLEANMSRIPTSKMPLPFGFRVLRVIPKN